MTQIVSSISGIEIYAPSAGFAPTNSADVSAIASGYQVVSATATQLYAGTAFLTGVNGTPMSASRAGQAANASLANSAYYDGTGRLISSLPDEATVSSIASSYAESAASGKADSSSLSSYALSSEVSGCIDTVSSNSASWGGGATGDYVETSATAVGIGSAITATNVSFAQGITCSAETNSLAQGTEVYARWASIAVGKKDTASWAAAALGYHNQATNSGVAIGSENVGNNGWTLGRYNTAKTTSVAIGAWNDASGDSVAIGGSNKAKKWAVALGIQNSAINSSTVIGQFNLCGDGDTGTGNSAAFVIGDGTAGNARHDLMLVTKDGEITMYSSTADTVGTGIMSSIRAISAAATGGGGDYLTSKVGSGRATFTTAFQDGMDKRPALCINGERGVDSAVYPRMLITDWNRSTGDTHSGTLLANAFEFYTCPTSARGEVDPSGVLLARLDDNKVEFNLDSSVTSKNRSAHFGRGGIFLGVSGASGSSIQIVNENDVAPYIVLDDNSGVTGRIDPSSMGYWNDKLDGSASSSFYTTANESGYVDSAYVDSAVSGKQDALTFAYDANSAISSINGSAVTTGAQVVTSITTGGYGVRAINGMYINASHMVLGAVAAGNDSNVVQLGNTGYGAGVFLTGSFGSAYYKVNELQLNRNGTGFIAFNIGGAGSQITATSYAGGKFSAGGTGGTRSYFTAFNASASASIEVTGSTSMINIADTGYTSTIYPSSIQSWNGKMDSSAVQSAYASASATQATAANVLYILLPDGA